MMMMMMMLRMRMIICLCKRMYVTFFTKWRLKACYAAIETRASHCIAVVSGVSTVFTARLLTFLAVSAPNALCVKEQRGRVVYNGHCDVIL